MYNEAVLGPLHSAPIRKALVPMRDKDLASSMANNPTPSLDVASSTNDANVVTGNSIEDRELDTKSKRQRNLHAAVPAFAMIATIGVAALLVAGFRRSGAQALADNNLGVRLHNQWVPVESRDFHMDT